MKNATKNINPDKKYHVISWRIGAPVDEKTDCGIWDGSGMAHFSEGFGGFTYSADGWLYFAQEAEDENTAQADQETAQEADDQESAPRLHKTSKRLEIAKAEIDKWNRMAESVKGTNSWALFNLWHDGIDHNGKWFALGNDHNIRAHMIPHPSDHYFIKKIKGNTWLYFEDCAGIQERWLLSDLAIAFFLPEPSQESSSDNSKEIIKETAEESTESNSNPHSQPVNHLKGAPRLINDSSDDQLASLKAKREQLAKKQHHILERYGNNQESQSIFKEITEIDSQIKRIEFKIGAVVRIVDLDSSCYGEWGIIEKFDGSFYYLAMHGDHEHAPMIIKEEQIELASGKEA